MGIPTPRQQPTHAGVQSEVSTPATHSGELHAVSQPHAPAHRNAAPVEARAGNRQLCTTIERAAGGRHRRDDGTVGSEHAHGRQHDKNQHSRSCLHIHMSDRKSDDPGKEDDVPDLVISSDPRARAILAGFKLYGGRAGGGVACGDRVACGSCGPGGMGWLWFSCEPQPRRVCGSFMSRPPPPWPRRRTMTMRNAETGEMLWRSADW